VDGIPKDELFVPLEPTARHTRTFVFAYEKGIAKSAERGLSFLL
jgi:hypothetical protein